MKTREETIEFDMNYCQHYGRGKGADMECRAGMDIRTAQTVPTGPKGYLRGPCIGGHTLANPHSHCPRWLRRTREQAEKRADEIEDSIWRMTVIGPAIEAWRAKPPIGKSEIIECPACKGRLHLAQAAYNGHVHGRCETEGCVAWME